MAAPSHGRDALRVYRPQQDLSPISSLSVAEWQQLIAVMRQTPGTLNPADAARLLDSLDVPDCTCSPVTNCGHDGDCDCDPELALKLRAPPCHHMEAYLARLKAHGFPLRIEEWGTLMDLAAKSEYADPPPPPHRETLTKKESIVKAMALRDGSTSKGKSARKFSLYHPRDTWRLLPMSDAVRVSREARHSSNGHAAKAESRGPLKVVGRQEEVSEALWGEWELELLARVAGPERAAARRTALEASEADGVAESSTSGRAV